MMLIGFVIGLLSGSLPLGIAVRLLYRRAPVLIVRDGRRLAVIPDYDPAEAVPPRS